MWTKLARPNLKNKTRGKGLGTWRKGQNACLAREKPSFCPQQDKILKTALKAIRAFLK
jgi:hypothetical protein